MAGTIDWSLYSERAVGRNSPSFADVVNRPLREVLTISGADPDASFVGFSLVGHTHDASAIVSGTLPTTRGGTGLSSPTAGGLLVAAGALAMTLLAPGAASQVVKSNGAAWASAAIVSADISDAASINTASVIVKRDGSGNFAAGTITASLTGNASTATALATGRTIWGQNFDGTANVSGALTGVSTVAASGVVTASGLTISAAIGKIIPGATSLSHRNSADNADNLLISDAGAITVRSTISGVTTLTAASVVAALTGNADTATKLATARTIAITGDLAYTSSAFDGSGNATAAGTLATVNANVGAFGGSTAIPVFTVNAKGLITAASTAVVIAPAGTLTGATLASNVLASSLTSVGVLASPHLTSAVIDSGGLTITAGTLAAQALTATTGNFSSTLSATVLTLSADLRLGGSTNLFSALVPVSGSLTAVELADHSDFADFKARALTLTSTLAVTGGARIDGNIAYLTAARSDIGFYMGSTVTLSGNANQYGFDIEPVFGSGATSQGAAGYFKVRTVAAAFTMGTGIGLQIDSPTIGAASAITTLYGLRIENQSGAGTNYAIFTNGGQHSFGGNLIWGTDNSFDIGAIGASRARDLFLARNATIGGATVYPGAVIGAGAVSLNMNTHAVTDYSRSIYTTSVSDIQYFVHTSRGGAGAWKGGHRWDVQFSAGAEVTGLYLWHNGTRPVLQTGGDIIADTDATYDVGASGASRFRDFFLARNATIGGTLAVSSDVSGRSVAYTNEALIPTSRSATGPLTFSVSATSGGASGNLCFQLGDSAGNWAWLKADASAVAMSLSNAGALAIGGTLAVTGTSQLTGNVGIGGAPTVNRGLFLSTAISAASGTATGYRNSPALSATANNDVLRASYYLPSFVPGAFTGVSCIGVEIGDITGGATNFALKTGLGAVQFGDVMTVTGLATMSAGVKINGGAFAAGVIYKDANAGLSFGAITATTSDAQFLTPAGSQIWAIPTGTTDIRFGGNLQTIVDNVVDVGGSGGVNRFRDVNVARDVNLVGVVRVNGTQVVSARSTGWTVQTATGAKTDLGAAPTVGALASWASAIQAALTTHGLLGA